jgi:4-amino-4-deoxy-L-arabinose transferase-like glycosyltransferase
MIIITLIIPFILGLAVTAALLGQTARCFGFWEKLAVAFAVGWAMHAIVMFLISLLGVPLVFLNILAADLLIAAALTAGFFKKIDWRQWRPRGPARPSLFGLALIAVMGLKFLSVFWASFIRPVLDPDIIGCYALGAKMIWLHKTILVHGPWGEKPLLPFLSQAWTAIGPQAWNDTLLTLPNPLLFLSFLIIFYSVLARYFKRWYALLATALLATIPFLAYQAGTAYTDFTQAFYYSLATFYLFLFMKEFKDNKEASAGYLLTGSLLLGLSIWAKKSGLYYAAIDLTALAAFLAISRPAIGKSDRRALLQSAALLIAVAAPWLLFNQVSTFRGYYVEVTSAAPVLPDLRHHSLPVLKALYRNAFFEDNWHCLGLLFLSALALYPKRALAGQRGFLLLIILLQLACLFALFRFTSLYQFIFNETLLNRLTFHFIPVILYFCAEVIGAGAGALLPSRPEREG